MKVLSITVILANHVRTLDAYPFLSASHIVVSSLIRVAPLSYLGDYATRVESCVFTILPWARRHAGRGRCLAGA